MKVDKITLDRIKNPCKCVFEETGSGQKILVQQCVKHKLKSNEKTKLFPSS